ncbi:MAG: glycosyltransferase family 4 protein [Gemmataceae bacterium]
MKIALIVQRYGSNVIGGSETLARQYAHLLSCHGEVEVLTTCAIDHISWRNHYASRLDVDGPIVVKRFPVDAERGQAWGRLFGTLQASLDMRRFHRAPDMKQDLARRLTRWPRALQEETIRQQGPYSTPLFDYLAHQQNAYDAFIFFAYLFPTTYFGMRLVPAARTIICPTLHDEPLAYLPIFRQVFQQPRCLLFLSRAERNTARDLFGDIAAHEIIGMTCQNIMDAGLLPPGTPARYILYAGRIEEYKGVGELLDHFRAFKRRTRSPLKLVFIGKEIMALPPHPDIVYFGFVNEAEKAALMRNAVALVHPSPYESFSIVLLEAFHQGTPVLVNGYSPALVEHCQHSGAGLIYHNQQEFIAGLRHLETSPESRQAMGQRGLRYVVEHFDPQTVARRLRAVIEQLDSASPRFTERSFAEERYQAWSQS